MVTAQSTRKGRHILLLMVAAGVALLGGCITTGKVLEPQEKFSSVSTYSRLYDASPAQTCEAARRALLSQGYIINTNTPDLIAGQKKLSARCRCPRAGDDPRRLRA